MRRGAARAPRLGPVSEDGPRGQAGDCRMSRHAGIGFSTDGAVEMRQAEVLIGVNLWEKSCGAAEKRSEEDPNLR